MNLEAWAQCELVGEHRKCREKKMAELREQKGFSFLGEG